MLLFPSILLGMVLEKFFHLWNFYFSWQMTTKIFFYYCLMCLLSMSKLFIPHLSQLLEILFDRFSQELLGLRNKYIRVIWKSVLRGCDFWSSLSKRRLSCSLLKYANKIYRRYQISTWNRWNGFKTNSYKKCGSNFMT